MKITKHYLLAILLAIPAIAFSQQNYIGLYSNYVSPYSYSLINNIGLKYTRDLNQSARVGISFDKQRNIITGGFFDSFKGYTLGGLPVINKSISFRYSDIITSRNLDLALDYNINKSKSKLYIRPSAGISGQFYKIRNIPFIEMLNYEIIKAQEVTSKKNFILPRVGLSVGYKLWKNVTLGADVYYRSVSLNRNKLVMITKTVSKSNGITIYDGSGGVAVIGEGSGEGIREILLNQQTGMGVHVNWRF